MKRVVYCLHLGGLALAMLGCSLEEEAPAPKPSSPLSQAEVGVVSLSISLATNTGDDADDFTTEATITLSSTEDAVATLSLEANGSPLDLSTNVFNLPASEDVDVDLALLAPSIVPTGDETNALRVTATLASNGMASPVLGFTLVAMPTQSEVSVIGFELEEDTGDELDFATTNASVIVSGTPPSNFELGFLVTTNGVSHAHDDAGTGTHDFSLSSEAERSLEVSVTPTFTRYGHVFVRAAHTFAYELVSWPPTLSIGYEDNGTNTTDGVTTESELTVAGFGGLEEADINLVGYVVASTERASESFDAEHPLSDDYEIDLREVRSILSTNETIVSLTFDYKGHAVTCELAPSLQYRAALFDRAFSIRQGSEGIAITSNNLILVASSITDLIHFYDTNGEAAMIEIDLTPDDAEEETSPVSNFAGIANDQLNNPRDLIVMGDGGIVVADYGNDRVQLFNADFSFRSSLTNDGLFPLFPSSVSFHEGFLYVGLVHSFSYKVRTYEEDDLTPRNSITASGTNYKAVAVGDGNVFHVLSDNGDRVEAFVGSPSSGFASRNHAYNMSPEGGGPSNPYDVLVGPRTGRIYISDVERSQVLVLGYDGEADENHYTLVGILGNETPGLIGNDNGEFSWPVHMLIHNGELYVVDKNNDRVQVFEVPE